MPLGCQPLAMLGFSLPVMLVWLAAAVLPPLLAWRSPRDPRAVRWAAMEFLVRAVRRGPTHVGGLPIVPILLRMLLLVVAAVAAARPFVTPASSSPRRPAVDVGVSAGGPPGPRIEIVVGGAPASGPPAIARAVEALAQTRPASPTVAYVPLATAAGGTAARADIIVLCDGSVPAVADAARIGRAVAGGAGLLVCIGPESVADGDAGRLSAWLEGLIGLTVGGPVDVGGETIEIDPELAADVGGPIRGPLVAAVADLGLPADGRATVLARTAGGRPLIVVAAHGRGRVCVAGVPLALPPRDTGDARDAGRGELSARRDVSAPREASAWSDLAAWPVFVPLVDRLLERLHAADDGGASAITAAAGSVPVVPLGTLLSVAAIGLAVADWLGSGRVFAAGRRRSWRRQIGHAGMVAAVVGLLAASLVELPVRSESDGRERTSRTVSLVIDTSPSMGSRDEAGANEAGPTRRVPAPTRLESLVTALRGAEGARGPLDCLARDRAVEIATLSGGFTRVGRWQRDVTADGVRALAAGLPAASPLGDASRLGDAVLAAVGADAEPPVADRPAVVVLASDGVRTGGISWSAAARAATERGVPLVAVPVGRDDVATALPSVPPGFRLTQVAIPRVCRESEPTVIEVRGEAATGAGPVPVSLYASAAADADPIATGLLTVAPPAAAADGIPAPRRYGGTLVVPPRAFGETGANAALRSPLVRVGPPPAADAAAVGAVLATVSALVTQVPIRVVLVEAGPRYEWRFLAHTLATTAGIESQSCLLVSGTTAGQRTTPPPPESVRDWDAFDVVVLGDVPAAAGRGAEPVPPAAWEALRSAVVDRGLGVAWIPGPRWWQGRGPRLEWLPAAAVGPMSAPASGLHRLEALAGAGDWVAWAADDWRPEVLALLRPVAIGPTARVLVTATADGRSDGATDRWPAVVVDRQGAGSVLGHFAETWRWRRGDPRRYDDYWRRAITRLAEPHLVGRLCAATIAVRPLAVTTADRVRIDLVPTRCTTDLAGWHLDLVSPSSAGVTAAGRRIPVPLPAGAGRGLTVSLGRLAAGIHEVRLVPPASAGADLPATPVVHTFVVTEPAVEMPGGPAATDTLAAVARATGGDVVPLDGLDRLPEVVAAAAASAVRRRTVGGRSDAGPLPDRRVHLLLLAVVTAGAIAWWPARPEPIAGRTA